MKNRVSEIEVPLMDRPNLHEILSRGENLLNISFPRNIANNIVTYSSGLPAVTHQLALLVCEENEISGTHKGSSAKQITPQSFDSAIDEYLEENSDTFKSIFETATKVIHKRKSENPKDILKAILVCNKENVSIHDVKDSIKLSNNTYTGNNLKKYVDELTTTERAEILRLNKDSNEYYFSNPFIKAYCQCALKDEADRESISASKMLEELRETLNKELEIARQSFQNDFEE